MDANVHQGLKTGQAWAEGRRFHGEAFGAHRKTRRLSYDRLAAQVQASEAARDYRPVWVQVRIRGEVMCAHVAGAMAQSGTRPALLKLDTPIGIQFRPAYETRACSHAGDGLCTCAARCGDTQGAPQRAALTPPGKTGVTL